MIRLLTISALAAATLASPVARADADSYYEHEQAQKARAHLYHGSVHTVSQRVAYIQALTGARVVKSSVRVNRGASACDGRAQTFVTATVADGRVCTSPAPTSCDTGTVSCE